MPRRDTLLTTARAIAVGSLAVIGALALRHAFMKDEIENVHSAWLVSTGLRPYTDFFQHHQPLLWDFLALFLPRAPNTPFALTAIRLAMFGCLFVIGLVTYRLAGANDTSAASVAVAFLFTLGDFVRNAYVIRPEVPATTCLIVGAWLVVPCGRQRLWRAVASGALLGIAVLFSLKSAPLVVLDAVVFAWWWYRGSVRTRFIAILAAAFALPIGLFALQLAVNGSLRDFYLSTWVVNVAMTSELMDNAYVPGSLLLINLPFWILGSLGALWVFARRQRTPALEMAAISGLGLIVSLVAGGRSESRSIWMASPFVAVTAGAAFVEGVRRRRLPPGVSTIVLLVLVAWPSFDAVRQLRETNQPQLALMTYVLGRTTPNDRVIDGQNQFNVFRPDVDYFWFYPRLQPTDPPSRAAAIRTTIAGMLERDPGDVCTLVRSLRPRIVASQAVDLAACGVTEDYTSTRYPGMFERLDR